jgi:hypothetical protein
LPERRAEEKAIFLTGFLGYLLMAGGINGSPGASISFLCNNLFPASIQEFIPKKYNHANQVHTGSIAAMVFYCLQPGGT